MRWLLGLAFLGGCGPCIVECGITGRIDLAVDLDPNSFYETLELQGYAKPSLRPVFHVTVPMRDVSFPYDYVLPQTIGSNDGIIFVRAWLSQTPTTSAVRAGEPYGKTLATTEGCTASGVDFAIDSIAGE